METRAFLTQNNLIELMASMSLLFLACIFCKQNDELCSSKIMLNIYMRLVNN